MRGCIVILVLVFAVMTVSAEPSAEQLVDEGQREYDAGHYAAAVARWQAAYETAKLPLIILNIAQAYRLGGDCVNALAAYRQYVALEPTAEESSLANGFIRELEPRCGAASRPSAEIPRLLPPVPRSGHGLKVAGLVTGGTGIALLTTGLVFGWRASSLGDEVTRDCLAVCNWSSESVKQRDGQRDATVGRVLDVAGAAAIAAGIGLYLYGARGNESALTIQTRADGATVSWSGQW